MMVADRHRPTLCMWCHAVARTEHACNWTGANAWALQGHYVPVRAADRVRAVPGRRLRHRRGRDRLAPPPSQPHGVPVEP